MGTVKVTIHDLSRGGNGVSKLDSGEILFVPFTAPGDEIEAKIVNSKKKFSTGEKINILRPSLFRETPKCSVFEKCGGCTWQHLSYPLQFETKKKGLLHVLKRVGVPTDAIPFDDLPAKTHYGYRNRIQLRGNSKTKEIGFYERGSKTMVSIESCPIADPKINEALPALIKQGFSEFDEHFKLEIEVLPNGKIQTSWNQPHAALGFRQVNEEQNQKLKTWIETFIKPGELLLDLYGGYGNLSLDLAPKFEKVICVDLFTPREADDLPSNFSYERKDMHRWSELALPKELQRKKTSVILDPPREGMSAAFPALREKLKKSTVESLILVGCDVDSFARDTELLIQAGYKLERLGALDLFPQTPHLESLALFSK